MNNKNTGGPAFPISPELLTLPDLRVVMGMNLRDYFAAKAMQALISEIGSDNRLRGTVVEQAYSLADGMLAERLK